ncbi:MFS transporter [Sulfurovum sp. zt1-1]|uniref:MFS transporter n=1 Tax=Sulfurovum zhangzhouensis TaxID=3019067 RepID=A0ABT7R1N1_9BACT|nr:MFS transporter [Sulfurovum zhangzhouensis]MDM5272709.1 MFS transporter [Sulfurovum zhangzhouensis]
MSIANSTKFTLLLLSMTTMMSNVAIVTSLPHLKDHFPDIAQIEFLSRMMLTLPSLAIAILAPFLGHLLHRFKRTHALMAALLFFSLAGSAGLYLPDIYSLLLSRFSLGIAIAVLMILTTSLVGDYFQAEERHRYMGLQSAFTSVGGLLFLLAGGILSDIDWRYTFGIYLVGVLFLPLVFLYIKEPSHYHVLGDEQSVHPKLFKIYLLAFILMLIFYILPTQMPFLMMNHFGADGKLTGMIIAMAFIFNALGAISFSRFKKSYDFKRIYMIGMTIVAVGFLLIGNVHNVYLFFFTSPILGFGGGLLMTNITAWMLHLAHESKRVKSSGYLTSSLFMGQFFSPIVFHPAVDYFGVQHFFVVTGMILGGLVLAAAGIQIVSKRDVQ